MPAFIIVETDIQDPDQYERYKEATPAAIEAAGGRFVVRGGDIAVLEGDWTPPRLVLLEFENLDAAKRFYESAEYQEVKRLREGAARLNMVAVEGLA
ncbi:MAG TPA: DUF1330 domain-containing protein [Solirubrobacteraceae bacterium]|nr:DUF1330 domain-containing protein [Solirubrobacteraceae bacterium]